MFSNDKKNTGKKYGNNNNKDSVYQRLFSSLNNKETMYIIRFLCFDVLPKISVHDLDIWFEGQAAFEMAHYSFFSISQMK